MTTDEIEAFLAGTDHRGTAILGVPRTGRGPLQVPLSFRYVDGQFHFATKPSRRHAQAFEAAGRASVIVHHEDYSGHQLERYVMAEGPIGWAGGRPSEGEFGTAVLRPTKVIGVVYGP